MTHYVPMFAKFIGVRERAVCGEYVLPIRHSAMPTCESCRELIEQNDLQRAREIVGIAEVIERY